MHVSQPQYTQKGNTKSHGSLEIHSAVTQTGRNANATFRDTVIFQYTPHKYPKIMSQHTKSHALEDTSFEK